MTHWHNFGWAYQTLIVQLLFNNREMLFPLKKSRGMEWVEQHNRRNSIALAADGTT